MSLHVDIEKCQGCAVCASVCPVQAVFIKENKAFIDQDRCNECLLCVEECPTRAIYQISDREVYLTKKEYPVFHSLNRTVPYTGQTFSSSKRKQQEIEKGGMFLDEVKKAMERFFKVDSSLGVRNPGGRMKYRRQRRRHRGKRF
jgi:MinD superfamily P-loop ATPase